MQKVIHELCLVVVWRTIATSLPVTVSMLHGLGLDEESEAYSPGTDIIHKIV